MAFFLASSASARPPATLGVGVLLLLLSLPPFPFRLMPESLGCRAAGLRPAAGRFWGGCGGVGFALPFAAAATAGGGGGGLGATTGAAACSST